MALERKVLEVYEGVKFQNFPLVEQKKGKNSTIWIFGGRYFSLFGVWEGVEYSGRYRFHVPSGKLATDGIWNLRKMWERVQITDAQGIRKELEREYFVLEPSELDTPRFFAAFIGGYYKWTFLGVGRDRDFRQYVDDPTVMVLASISNSCRSGRYGNFANFVIASNPIEVQSMGVK
jgi:hypothetical protein